MRPALVRFGAMIVLPLWPFPGAARAALELASGAYRADEAARGLALDQINRPRSRSPSHGRGRAHFAPGPDDSTRPHHSGCAFCTSPPGASQCLPQCGTGEPCGSET